MASGDHGAPVDLGSRLAADLPRVRGRGGRVIDGLHQLLAARELAVRDRSAGARDAAIGRYQRGAIGIPGLRGEVDQQLARGRGYFAQAQSHIRRGTASGGSAVVGSQIRVGHHEAHRSHGQAQFFADHLSQ